MAVTVVQHKNFVGGEWVDSIDGGTMEVLNPSTGETIAEVPSATAADVDRAVEAAKKALPEWLETTPQERSELLLRLAALIDEHADELAQIESQNVGKPLSYARDEMPVCSDNIRFFAGAARILEGRSSARGREHPGAEAVGADSALAAPVRAARRGDPARRRPERRHR